MDAQIRQDFRHFLYNGASMLVGRQAEMALRDARILRRFRELEADGKVRLRAEDEQESYFDVFGESEGLDRNGHPISAEQARKDMIETLETYGNYWCVAEYLTREECPRTDSCECPFHQDAREEWEQADSIGMCAGYKDVLDPFENCYIIDLMASAIEKYEGE